MLCWSRAAGTSQYSQAIAHDALPCIYLSVIKWNRPGLLPGILSFLSEHGIVSAPQWTRISSTGAREQDQPLNTRDRGLEDGPHPGQADPIIQTDSYHTFWDGSGQEIQIPLETKILLLCNHLFLYESPFGCPLEPFLDLELENSQIGRSMEDQERLWFQKSAKQGGRDRRKDMEKWLSLDLPFAGAEDILILFGKRWPDRQETSTPAGMVLSKKPSI